MKRGFKLGVLVLFLLVSMIKVSANGERVVVIDPGHGGKDTGTSGNGFLEKDLNLDIAWAVTEFLRENGVTVYMTRETDKTMELSERSEFTNNINPDLTVSIHNDYSMSGKGDGSHVIYSHWDKSGGTTKTLARNILDSIVANTGQNKSNQDIWYRIIDSGDKKGLDYYHIIREIKTPAVIVECAFVNTIDVTSLDHDTIMPLAIDTPDKRDDIGVAIGKGILRTLDEIKSISQNDYIGDINTDVQHIELSRNHIGDYLYGEIIIVEWIDDKSAVPSTLPKMYLKSEEGSFAKELFVTKTGTNTYYFDGFINGLDMTKEYYIKVESASKNNVSTLKAMDLRTDNSPLIIETGILGSVDSYKAYYSTDFGKLKLYFH